MSVERRDKQGGVRVHQSRELKAGQKAAGVRGWGLKRGQLGRPGRSPEMELEVLNRKQEGRRWHWPGPEEQQRDPSGLKGQLVQNLQQLILS